MSMTTDEDRALRRIGIGALAIANKIVQEHYKKDRFFISDDYSRARYNLVKVLFSYPDERKMLADEIRKDRARYGLDRARQLESMT